MTSPDIQSCLLASKPFFYWCFIVRRQVAQDLQNCFSFHIFKTLYQNHFQVHWFSFGVWFRIILICWLEQSLHRIGLERWSIKGEKKKRSQRKVIIRNVQRISYNTNPCLEVVLSMKKNFLLIQGIFWRNSLAIADKNNEEEGKILP